jgi:hypothetical protein
MLSADNMTLADNMLSVANMLSSVNKMLSDKMIYFNRIHTCSGWHPDTPAGNPL